MIKKVVFGGGCFWCTEAIFNRVKGVESVSSGYAGGLTDNPTYQGVCGGETGHAEVVEVTYNETQISLRDLLLIHLFTHDPTTLNRQGADMGSQYRSIVFYQNEEELNCIKDVLAELSSSFPEKIVTEVAPLGHFYQAEEYHQGYYEKSPNNYCEVVIAPKLKKFKDKFKEFIKA